VAWMKLAQVVTGQQTMEKQIKKISNTSYLISILITQNGYSFFVLDNRSQKIETHTSEVIEQANAELILSKIRTELEQSWLKEYTDAVVELCYHHSYFSVVPSAIFKKDQASNYLKYNTKLYSNDSISCEVNTKLDLSIAFIPYINIHNELLDTYETVNFTHSVNSAINWAFTREISNKGEQVYAIIQKEAFVLIIIKEGKLVLANYFAYKTEEDFVYYCLFAIEQHNCNREAMLFSLLGEVSTESKIYSYLYKYIKNIALISLKELPIEIELSVEEEEFFISNPFLALQLCESFQED
jgi:hypothetical protein